MTQQSTWSRVPDALFARKDVTPLTKLVYCYMLGRYEFFVVQQKKTYFETQEQIADACGIGRTATNDAIQKLLKLGWLKISKHKKHGTVFNNIYTVYDEFCVYSKTTKRVLNKKIFDPSDEDDIF